MKNFYTGYLCLVENETNLVYTYLRSDLLNGKKLKDSFSYIYNFRMLIEDTNDKGFTFNIDGSLITDFTYFSKQKISYRDVVNQLGKNGTNLMDEVVKYTGFMREFYTVVKEKSFFGKEEDYIILKHRSKDGKYFLPLKTEKVSMILKSRIGYFIS